MNIYSRLSDSPLFNHLNAEHVKHVMQDIIFQIRNYADGDIIVTRGEPCDFLLIILLGTVKGEMLDASGRVLKIEDIKAVRPLAPAFIFGGKNTFPVSIIAISEVKIMYIPKASLLRLMSKSDVFLNNFLDVISSRAQFLTERFYFLSFKTLGAKLVNYLLELSKDGHDTFILPHSHIQLAEMFGVARPSLSRILVNMQKNGLIKLNRKEIQILDRKRLMEYA